MSKCTACGARIDDRNSFCPKCGAAISASGLEITGVKPPDKLQFVPGQSFGQYTIIEEVGSGGQASVFKALEPKLKRTIALKLVPPQLARNPKHVERFRREFILAQKVTHPNVCRLHDINVEQGIHFIVMEFIDGQKLTDWIQTVSHLSRAQTVNVGRQICAGLAAIHAQSIVHRDLKPHNIMLDRSGRCVVMDFGLAYRPDEDSLTGSGGALGTLAYLSPEQARGKRVDPRSDIYAVGLVLYEMLTGRRPPADHESVPLALREPGTRCPPPSELVPDVTRALDAVVMRCLERDPADRFQTADELSAALAEAEESSSATSAGRLRRQVTARSPWSLGMAAVATVGILLALLWFFSLAPEAPRSTRDLSVQALAYDGPPGSSYLAQLIAVAIQRGLRDTGGLVVTPFESSRSFPAEEEPGSIAQQLDVDLVLQGAVRVAEDDFEMVLRLHDAEGDEIWSGEFSGRGDEVLEAADVVVAELADALRIRRQAETTIAPSSKALEYYLEGKSYLEGWDVARNPERSVEAFLNAIRADADFAEAHAGLASAIWRQYRETLAPELVARASSAAERAVALSPDLPEGLLALGEIQLGTGQSAEARASFTRAQSLAPGNDAICRRIGDVYAALERNDEALEMYRRAITLRERYWENHNYLGAFYLQLGEWDQAATAFRKVIELRPESDVGYLNLAATRLYAGELDQAEPLLLAALRLNPTAESHSNLGFIYYARQQYERAAEQFREAARLGNEDALYYSNLGDAYRQLSLSVEANEAYMRAVELGSERLRVNPEDSDVAAELSMALAGAERCSEAGSMAERSGERASPNAHYYIAISYALCGDREAAIYHARQASDGGIDIGTSPDLAPILDSSQR